MVTSVENVNTYSLIRVVGEGSTARVYAARRKTTDVTADEIVALKVFRDSRDGQENASIELRVYEYVHSFRDTRRELFLEPLDVVIGTGVAYIAMPLLQLAVEDALQIRGISPLPVVDVNTVFDQVLRGVQYLHSIALIHTDINCRNVMLVSADTTTLPPVSAGTPARVRFTCLQIRIVDLCDCGGIANSGQAMVGTALYRAPEVTLGLPWNTEVDSFGLGCVLVQLLTGKPVFPVTNRAAERMFALQQVIEPVPRAMLARSRLPPSLLPIANDGSIVVRRRNVREATLLERVRHWPALSEQVHDAKYAALCRALLRVDPQHRMQASRCVSPLLDRWKEGSGTE